MEKALIVGSENITGNIGSCQTTVVEAFTAPFVKTVYFTNSCTGEIVNSSTFFDWGVPILLVGVFFLGFVILKDI